MKIFDSLISFYRKKFWSGVKYARFIGVNVGKDCHIATTNFGTEPYLITIGNHVQLTIDVKFFTHTGGWTLRKDYPRYDSFGKIVLGNNIYVGNNVLILPGVTIGDNVIIGAGAVVTKSFPAQSIIGGNPAKIIGNYEDYKIKMLPYNMNTKGLSPEQKRDILMNSDDSKFIKK